MKWVSGVVLCLFLLQAKNIKAAEESVTFVFDGSELSKHIDLKKAVYSTQYRTEEYEDTCSREVQDGTRQECSQVSHQSCQTIPESCSTSYEQECTSNPPICHSTPQTCRHVCEQAEPACRNVCHHGPNGEICREVCSAGTQQCHNECDGGGESCTDGGQSCQTVPRESCTPSREECSTYYTTECETVPNYRTEYYSCTRTREVPYEQFEYNLAANIDIGFDAIPAGLGAREEFTLSLTDKDVAMKVDSSKKLLIFVHGIHPRQRQGDTISVYSTYHISFMNIAEITVGLQDGITDVGVDEKGILQFAVGVFGSKLNFMHSLQIMQAKLGKDQELYNKEIDPKLLTLTNLNGKNYYSVDLNKLIKLNKKKLKITIKSVVLLGQAPINAADIPKLEVTKLIKERL